MIHDIVNSSEIENGINFCQSRLNETYAEKQKLIRRVVQLEEEVTFWTHSIFMWRQKAINNATLKNSPDKE